MVARKSAISGWSSVVADATDQVHVAEVDECHGATGSFSRAVGSPSSPRYALAAPEHLEDALVEPAAAAPRRTASGWCRSRSATSGFVHLQVAVPEQAGQQDARRR